jgi:hypothetical protein
MELTTPKTEKSIDKETQSQTHALVALFRAANRTTHLAIRVVRSGSLGTAHQASLNTTSVYDVSTGTPRGSPCRVVAGLPAGSASEGSR